MGYYDDIKNELTKLLSDFQSSGSKFDENFNKLEAERKVNEAMKEIVMSRLPLKKKKS